MKKSKHTKMIKNKLTKNYVGDLVLFHHHELHVQSLRRRLFLNGGQRLCSRLVSLVRFRRWDPDQAQDQRTLRICTNNIDLVSTGATVSREAA